MGVYYREYIILHRDRVVNDNAMMYAQQQKKTYAYLCVYTAYLVASFGGRRGECDSTVDFVRLIVAIQPIRHLYI